MRRQVLAAFAMMLVLTGVSPAQRTARPPRPRPIAPAPAASSESRTPAPPPAAAPGDAPAGGAGTSVRTNRIYYYGWPGGVRPLIVHGNNPRVRVQFPPRLSWELALPAAARESAQLHDSTKTTYQIWVPTSYRHALPHPLVLFVSAKPVPDELLAFDAVCRKYGVLFAVAFGGGDDCHPAKRLRLALDVLDDIRRRMNVDTDRIYVGGFSEGGRTACELAYAYPEFIGGVIAIGGAGPLRGEPWLRERVKDRLSVALLTGELSPARVEVELYRYPVLRELNVRSRLWTVPRLGQTMPPALVLEEVFVWLEMNRPARRLLGMTYAPARMAEGVVPPAEQWARGVYEEASRRVKDARTREAGLLQLEGVARRWSGSEAARKAEKRLEEHNNREKVQWQSVYDRRQLEFFHLEARALDSYLAAGLSPRDLLRRPALLQEALALWEQVEKHGADTEAGGQATRRLEELRKLLPGR